MWQNWVNAVVGIWLILAPFLLDFADKNLAKWNSVLFGIVVVALSLWVNGLSNGKGVSRGV